MQKFDHSTSTTSNKLTVLSLCEVSEVKSLFSITTVRANLPVVVSHTLTVWSNEPVSSWSPVVLKEHEIISAEWPCEQRVY